MSRPPARYFPVDRRPLHMRPRLQPFPTPLGNDEADARCFQLDDDAPAYLGAKHPERYRIARGDLEDRAHARALAFAETRLRDEHPGFAPAPPSSDPAARYAAIASAVQEDFSVHLRAPDGSDRAVALYVSFPSSWRPEETLGWSFQRIHAPVPDFADADAAARSLVDAMTLRGPYLRFVWTVCADDALDHHPDAGHRRPFGPDTREGWLRVERQVTVPFPDLGPPGAAAALFLIRTYLRPFSQLLPGERETLAEALRRMPAASARYKGLDAGRARAIELLGEPPAGEASPTA